MSLLQNRVPLTEYVFFQEGPGLRKWQWTDDGMKVINVTNLLGDEAYTVDTTNTDKYISLVEFEEKYSHFEVDDGDFVVASSGNTYGKVGKITQRNLPLMMNTSVIRFRSNNLEKLDDQYLFCFLRSKDFRGQIDAFVTGGAQPNFGPSHLKKMDIPLPDIDLQRKIGAFITDYDNLIENNRRRIQLLEESARLLYQEWFVHLRFPGHEQVKIIDGVPEGWEPTLVPDVIDVNPRTPVEKGKEIWYVPMSSLSETAMTANTADFERRTKHTNVKFKKNDVLLARITPCLENGKTGYAYFLAEDEVACGSTEFIVLRGNRVPSEFVYCLARSYPFRENAIKSMTGSSGRQRVQNSCFDKYAVPLPPKSILDEFVQVVQNNFDQVRNLMAQNAKLAQARDLLLPKLMSGELTV